MITGTIVNVVAVLLGGFIGLILKSRLPLRITTTFFQAIGLFTLFLGIVMSIKTTNAFLLVSSLILGALTGSALRLEQRMEGLGVRVQSLFRIKGGRFSEGMITAFLMYCMGSMTLLGAIEEGLGNPPRLLLIKSLMDGFTSIAFAATLGVGVLFSVLPLLLYQGGITLLVSFLGESVSNTMIDEISATGGILLLGLGISILGIKKVEVMNLLPSLLYIIVLFYYFG